MRRRRTSNTSRSSTTNTWTSSTGRNRIAGRRRLREWRARCIRGKSRPGRRRRPTRCEMQRTAPPQRGPHKTQDAPHGLESARQIAHPQPVPHKTQECRARPAPPQGAHRQHPPKNPKQPAPPQEAHRSRAGLAAGSTTLTQKPVKLKQKARRSPAPQEANRRRAGQPTRRTTLKHRLQLRLRHHRHGQGHQTKKHTELKL